MLWLWLLATPKLILGAALSGLWWTPSSQPPPPPPTPQSPVARPQGVGGSSSPIPPPAPEARRQPPPALLPTGKGAKRQLVVVMLDGSRWDYLELLSERDMGGFRFFKDGGVRVEYVESVFPSVTYPAWTTLGTGLHPESHDVLGNSMYDRDTQLEFNASSTQLPMWWQEAEPIWVTVTLQGLRAATIEWNRADVPFRGVLPEVAKGYTNSKRTFADRIEEVIWRLRQGFDLVMMYYEKIDSMGHHYGPATDEVFRELRVVGRGFDRLFNFVTRGEGSAGDVHVLVVADHGMAHACSLPPLNVSRYADVRGDAEKVVCEGASVALYAKPGRRRKLLEQLKDAPGYVTRLREDIPLEFHYKEARRAPDLLMFGLPVPWNDTACPMRGGVHGFDPTRVPEMRSLFLGWGSAFAGPGLVHPPLRLVDIYQLYTYVLHVTPRPNNGSWEAVQGMLLPDAKGQACGGGGGVGGGGWVGDLKRPSDALGVAEQQGQRMVGVAAPGPARAAAVTAAGAAGRVSEGITAEDGMGRAYSTQVRLKPEDGSAFSQSSQNNTRKTIYPAPPFVLPRNLQSSSVEKGQDKQSNVLNKEYGQSEKDSKYSKNYSPSGNDEALSHFMGFNTFNTQRQMGERITQLLGTTSQVGPLNKESNIGHNIATEYSARERENSHNYVFIPTSSFQEDLKLGNSSSYPRKRNDSDVSYFKNNEGSTKNSYDTTIQNENMRDNLPKYSGYINEEVHLPENSLINLKTRNERLMDKNLKFTGIKRRTRGTVFTVVDRLFINREKWQKRKKIGRRERKLAEEKEKQKFINSTPTTLKTDNSNLPSKLDDENLHYVCSNIAGRSVGKVLPSNELDFNLQGESDDISGFHKIKVFGGSNILRAFHPSLHKTTVIDKDRYDSEYDKSLLNVKSTSSEASAYVEVSSKTESTPTTQLLEQSCSADEALTSTASSDATTAFSGSTGEEITESTFVGETVTEGKGESTFSSTRSLATLDNYDNHSSDQSTMTPNYSECQLSSMGKTGDNSKTLTDKELKYDNSTSSMATTNVDGPNDGREKYTTSGSLRNLHTGSSSSFYTETTDSIVEQSMDNYPTTTKKIIDEEEDAHNSEKNEERLVRSGPMKIRTLRDGFHLSQFSGQGEIKSESYISYKPKEEKLVSVPFKNLSPSLVSTKEIVPLTNDERTFEGSANSNSKLDSRSDKELNSVLRNDRHLSEDTHIIDLKLFTDAQRKRSKLYSNTKTIATTDISNNNLYSLMHSSNNGKKQEYFQSLVTQCMNRISSETSGISDLKHENYRRDMHFGHPRVTREFVEDSALGRSQYYHDNTNTFRLRKEQKLESDSGTMENKNDPDSKLMKEALQRRRLLITALPTIFGGEKIIDLKSRLEEFEAETKSTRELHSTSVINEITEGSMKSEALNDDSNTLNCAEHHLSMEEGGNKYTENYNAHQTERGNYKIQQNEIKTISSNTRNGGKSENQRNSPFKKDSVAEHDSSSGHDSVKQLEKDFPLENEIARKEVENEGIIPDSTLFSDDEENKSSSRKQSQEQYNYSANGDEETWSNIEDLLTTTKKSVYALDTNDIVIGNNQFHSYSPYSHQHKRTNYDTETTLSQERTFLNVKENGERGLYRIKSKLRCDALFSDEDDEMDSQIASDDDDDLKSQITNDYDDDILRTHRRRTTERVLLRERIQSRTSTNPEDFSSLCENMQIPQSGFSDEARMYDSTESIVKRRVKNNMNFLNTKRVYDNSFLDDQFLKNRDTEEVQKSASKMSKRRDIMNDPAPGTKENRNGNAEYLELFNEHGMKCTEEVERKFQNEKVLVSPQRPNGELNISNTGSTREIVTECSSPKEINLLGNLNYYTEETLFRNQDSIYGSPKIILHEENQAHFKNTNEDDKHKINARDIMDSECECKLACKDSLKKLIAEENILKSRLSRKLHNFLGRKFKSTLKEYEDSTPSGEKTVERYINQLTTRQLSYENFRDLFTSASGSSDSIQMSTRVFNPTSSDSSFQEQETSLNSLVGDVISRNSQKINSNREQKQPENNSYHDLDTNLLKLHELMNNMNGKRVPYTSEKFEKRGEHIKHSSHLPREVTKCYQGSEKCKHSNPKKAHHVKNKNYHDTQEYIYRKKSVPIKSNVRRTNNRHEGSKKYTAYKDTSKETENPVQRERKKGCPKKLTTNSIYSSPKHKPARHTTKQDDLEYLLKEKCPGNELNELNDKNENRQKFTLPADDSSDSTDVLEDSISDNSPDQIDFKVSTLSNSNIQRKKNHEQLLKVTEGDTKHYHSYLNDNKYIDNNNGAKVSFLTKRRKAYTTQSSEHFNSIANNGVNNDVDFSISIDFLDGKEQKSNSGNSKPFEETNRRDTIKQHSHLEGIVPSGGLNQFTVDKITSNVLAYKTVIEHKRQVNHLINIKQDDQTKLSLGYTSGLDKDIENRIRLPKHIQNIKHTGNSSTLHSAGYYLDEHLEDNPINSNVKTLEECGIPLQPRRKRSLSRNENSKNPFISPESSQLGRFRSTISNPFYDNNLLYSDAFHETSLVSPIKHSQKGESKKNLEHQPHNHSLMNGGPTQKYAALGLQATKFPCAANSRIVRSLQCKKRNIPNLNRDGADSFRTKSTSDLNISGLLLNSYKLTESTLEGHKSLKQNNISEILPIPYNYVSLRFLNELEPENHYSNSKNFHLYAPDEQEEHLGASARDSLGINLELHPLVPKYDIVRGSNLPSRARDVSPSSPNQFHLKPNIPPRFPVTSSSPWGHQMIDTPRSEQQKTGEPQAEHLQSKESNTRPAASFSDQTVVRAASTNPSPISSDELLLQLPMSSIQLGSAGYLRGPHEWQSYLEQREAFTRAWERYFRGVREERTARRTKAALAAAASARAPRTPATYAPIHPAALRPQGSCM